MRDRVLDEEIKDLNSFIEQWSSFSRLMGEARGTDSVEESVEKSFATLRTEISRRYPAMMQRLEVSCGDQDNMVILLGKMNSLAVAAKSTDIQWKKLVELQGKVGVTLNGILGLLQTRRRKLRKVLKSRIVLRGVFTSWFVKLIALTAGVLLFFLVLDIIF